MIEKILGRFRYVKKMELEVRERRHNDELYQRLIASMTAHRDLLLSLVSDQKSVIARLEKREEDRAKTARDLVVQIVKSLPKGRS